MGRVDNASSGLFFIPASSAGAGTRFNSGK
jgi:hypothetical protein